jgi:adenylate cyclase
MVFVGATALGFGDVFKSPFAPDLPGVEVLASVAENIEQGRILRRDSLSWSLDMGLGAVFALLAFLAANARALPVSGLLYASLWPAAGAALQYLFQARLFWLDGAAMVLTLTATGLCVFGARLRLQRRVAAKLRQQRDHLASYQSPLLREWLAGPEAPDRSGRMQLATILFVDLSGFTRRAQAMGPAATSSFLRDLHRLFERAALAHEGVIESFAGDGAMLIFGLPRARPTDAPRALLCVRDMLRDVEHWSGELASAGGEPLALRAGLHSGPVMVARLGGDRQAHVTASGDTVNVASRLLDIAKREAAPIVATADFAAAVRAAGRADLLEASRALSGQSLRGRAGDMDLLLLG